MMVFPIFIPSGGGGGGGSGAGTAAMLIAIPLYAFVVFGAWHFLGFNLGWVMDQWWGPPAMITLILSYVGAVLGTAVVAEAIFDN